MTHASMGPLHACSGESRKRASSTPRSSWLQWGRCTHAAESGGAWGMPATIPELQWGRCTHAAESGEQVVEHHDRPVASMGPLHACSGEARPGDALFASELASMGPLHACSGEGIFTK